MKLDDSVALAEGPSQAVNRYHRLSFVDPTCGRLRAMKNGQAQGGELLREGTVQIWIAGQTDSLASLPCRSATSRLRNATIATILARRQPTYDTMVAAIADAMENLDGTDLRGTNPSCRGLTRRLAVRNGRARQESPRPISRSVQVSQRFSPVERFATTLRGHVSSPLILRHVQTSRKSATNFIEHGCKTSMYLRSGQATFFS